MKVYTIIVLLDYLVHLKAEQMLTCAFMLKILSLVFCGAKQIGLRHSVGTLSFH